MSRERTLYFNSLSREEEPFLKGLTNVREFSYYVFEEHKVDRPCYGGTDLLIVLFQGQGRYFHGDQESEGGRGSLIYYAKGEWQKYQAAGRYEGIGFHFHVGTSLAKVLKHYGIVSGKVCPGILAEHHLAELSEVFAYSHLPPAVAFHKMDILVERLMLMMGMDEPGHRQTPHRMRLEDLRRYIQQHPEADLSVSRLARSVNLSPSRFAAVFRKEFGEPVGTFIRQTRLDYARRILLTTDLTAAEMGIRLGYSSPFAFYAAYKTHHGSPPGTIKKAKR